MNCRTVENSLSAHLDGALSQPEARGLMAHIDVCPDCESRLAQLARVQAALRKLPKSAPPERLTTALRVMASKERARVIARRRGAGILPDRIRLWADDLMRPLALPFAGGLISAMLLFGMLIPTFTMHRVSGTDIPVALFTEPYVKAQAPFASFDNNDIDFDIDVEVTVDSTGRMVDYSLPKGSKIENYPGLRRALENKLLLFTEFAPATMFGQTTYGKVYVSFQRRSIDIKS
ncbi:MAG: anti-sigma factor family protein [Acidobacteriota bacterium]